ncbi:MAG: acetolactate synthase large subunit [Desulfohalobiaceae bacterium]
MNGAALLAECLKNEGVDIVFGIPGEENLDLLEGIRQAGIEFIVTRHEQAAGFMAATYGRLTDKPGVCLSTLGPGATNLVTSTSFALLGGMPVLFLTGQKPIRTSKQGSFQILDVVRMMEPVTKYSKQIVNAGSIPSLIRDVFRIALEEKPGPVHLELPEDIAGDETEARPYVVTPVYNPAPNREAVDTAAQIIHRAEHPLLLIAAGANRKETSAALRRLVDKSGMYFFSTQMGKGVVDERHEQHLGTAALSSEDYIHCAIDKADLIINVGHDLAEKPPFLMHRRGKTSVIHINYSPAQIDDVYFPQHEVIGDITQSIRELTDAVEPFEKADSSYFKLLKDEIEANVYTGYDETTFPHTPQKNVADIRQTLPDNAIIALDNGMYKIWVARNLKAYDERTVLLDNALASMGAGLPSAIAAKLIHPDRHVLALCGDGGFLMNCQELETAVRLGLDLIVLVIRDDAYGMIKWKQTGMELPAFGLDFKNPDLVGFVRSFGATGHRIEGPGQLSDLLRDCLHRSGVQVIETPIDYSENVRVFFEELRQKTCRL